MCPMCKILESCLGDLFLSYLTWSTGLVRTSIIGPLKIRKNGSSLILHWRTWGGTEDNVILCYWKNAPISWLLGREGEGRSFHPDLQRVAWGNGFCLASFRALTGNQDTWMPQSCWEQKGAEQLTTVAPSKAVLHSHQGEQEIMSSWKRN